MRYNARLVLSIAESPNLWLGPRIKSHEVRFSISLQDKWSLVHASKVTMIYSIY